MRVTVEGRPAGPAENALIYVDHRRGPSARYISWINLYDIDHAARLEPKCWELVEPHKKHSVDVQWLPYGWGGEKMPSIADVESNIVLR